MDGTFSIWIIPPKEIKDKLSNIMNQLSAKYYSPFITPHITILPVLKGNILEIKSRINKLIKNTRPFTVKFDKLNYGNSYYKSVFIEIINYKQLDKLYRVFHDSFKDILELPETHLKFAPHLSLIYGDFNQKVKLGIIEGLKRFDFKYKFRADEVSLVLMKSSDTKDWNVVENFKFKAFAT